MTSQTAMEKAYCLVFLFSTVWIQPGEVDCNWEAARLPGPILPPLLADVQQPSGEPQGQSQGQ